jgi:hypothetical protein
MVVSVEESSPSDGNQATPASASMTARICYPSRAGFGPLCRSCIYTLTSVSFFMTRISFGGIDACYARATVGHPSRGRPFFLLTRAASSLLAHPPVPSSSAGILRATAHFLLSLNTRFCNTTGNAGGSHPRWPEKGFSRRSCTTTPQRSGLATSYQSQIFCSVCCFHCQRQNIISGVSGQPKDKEEGESAHSRREASSSRPHQTMAYLP